MQEGGLDPLEAEGERLIPRGVVEVGVALEVVKGNLWELGESQEEVGSIWAVFRIWWAFLLCRSWGYEGGEVGDSGAEVEAPDMSTYEPLQQCY